jgi:hypothetical protein
MISKTHAMVLSQMLLLACLRAVMTRGLPQ